jgi:signal peptidase I
MKKSKRILKWSLWTLLILFLVRIFLFQIVSEKDFHMASTLLPGDRVLVNKFSAGYRVPMSIVGLPGPAAPYADVFRLPYMRLPGFRKFRHQDVVLFNFPAGADKPIDRKRVMISRIIGLPDDTVLIKDKIVYVNHVAVPPPATARSEYRVINNGQPINKDFLYRYDIEQPRKIADIGIWDMDLPAGASEVLSKMEGIKTVRETKFYFGDPSTDYYPNSNFFMWNRDQYGLLRVPSKGMTVPLDVRTVDFYRDPIETHEGHEVMVDFRGVFIDGQPATSYTFTKNYYFVLSDNRDNPDDSRKIGFIPEDHLIGVVRRILWSHQNRFDYLRKTHLNRILKSVR